MEGSHWNVWRWLKGWKRSYAIVLVVLLAALLRAWAVWQLPLDYDEPIYLSAASDYAQQIAAGDVAGVVDYGGNREHPALVKLVYSAPFLLFEENFGQKPQLYFDRAVSAVFGVLTVLLVALIDPLAGLLLAFHSMSIKYTSQAYLEAIPLFLALAAVLALRRAVQTTGRRWGWLVLSALSFGAAAAGKYTYAMVIVTLAFVWFGEGRGQLRMRTLAGYLGLTLFGFWLFNPTLWREPLARLWESLFFHTQYAQGVDVLQAAYPWYQPFLWLFGEVPWHPQVFFFLTTDTLVAVFSLLGLRIGWKKYAWVLVWSGVALLVLLLWPTKWPQYTIILTPALALIAAAFIRRVVQWASVQESYWNYLEEMLPRPPRLFWFLLAGLLVFITIGKLGYEFNLAVLREGWVQAVNGISPLPSNQVYDVAMDDSGRVYLGTSNGLAVWKPEAGSPWGADAQILLEDRARLDGAEVLALLGASDGTFWLGTQQGLLRGDGQTFHAEELGFEPGRVLALAEGADGEIWIGATRGAARLAPGQSWVSVPVGVEGLLDETVFCIEAEGDVVWFGSVNGVSRLDGGSWQQFDFRSMGFGWGGVADLMRDAQGQVWAATLGGGLGVWNGTEWQFYRTSNSDLPFNTINAILEVEPGVYWLAVGYPTEPGGLLVRLDRRGGQGTEQWQVYLPGNSGFLGQEPLAMALDGQTRLWVGTATGGVYIYDHPLP